MNNRLHTAASENENSVHGYPYTENDSLEALNLTKAASAAWGLR